MKDHSMNTEKAITLNTVIVDRNWVDHKNASFLSINEHTILRGRVYLQSLRRSRARLHVKDYEVNRIGRSLSSGRVPDLHFYGLMNEKKMQYLEDIRDGRGVYLGKVGEMAGNEISFLVPLSMPNALQIISVVVVMQNNLNDPKAMIAYGDFSAGYETERIRETAVASQKNTTSACFVTAVGPLNIDEPLEESVVRDYAFAAQSIMRNLNVPETSKINFEAFQRGLESINVFTLEKRALSLFKSCDKKNLGLLTVTDLEVCLMVNDAKPTRADQAPNLYEIFSSYDIDKTGRLNFIQFQECVSTPGLKSSSAIRDLGTLHYIFQKFVGRGIGIDFPSFCKLWTKYLVNPRHELARRCQSVQNTDRVIKRTKPLDIVLPFLRTMKEKNRLYEIVKNDYYDVVSNFAEISEKIIQMRKESQSNSDEKRRLAAKIGNRQKRETRIGGIERNKNKDNFIVKRRKDGYLRKRRLAVRKIKDDCEISIQETVQSIITDREEKDAKEAESVRDTFGDRLILRNSGLVEVPKNLYDGRNSQMKLMDLKLLDFSRNSLKTLPNNGFLFHLTSIRKLVLSHNNLHEIPKEIDSLKRLEILSLNQNSIEQLPDSLYMLECLQILDLSFNKIRVLSPNFSLLYNVRILKINSNGISDLPSDIGKLKKLEFLDISKNKVGILPDSICSLSSLFEMNVSLNKLPNLPTLFGNLTKLEVLDASCNEIQEIPTSMSTLNKVRVLNFDDNKLVWVPDCVKGLRNVTTFSCKRNEILKLSIETGNMVLIEQFSCDMNKIKEIPQEIGLLKNLRYLKLQHNSIEVVPTEMGALVHLLRLDLSHNRIRIIPNEFCLMKSLIWLDVSYNRLEHFPKNMGALSNISTLKASHNKISCLPPSFQYLRCLEELILPSNNFRDFDLVLCNQLSMKVLDFEANRIKYLPQEICQMSKLEDLNLRHNDIRSIPLGLAKCAHETNGRRIYLDLSQNPLTDLPLKFSTASNNNYYQNPSGWNLKETFDWMNDENTTYKPALREWSVKKDAYISGYLKFDDFFKGVQWRCENLSGSLGNKSFGSDIEEVFLKSKNHSIRLKRFFFYCKKYGCPPVYETLTKEELCSREKEARELEMARIQRAESAKKTAVERGLQEYDIYFGNMSERCAKADALMSHEIDQRRLKDHLEFEHILTEVKSRVEKKNILQEERKLNEAMKSAKEAKELVQISFQSYTNKKRILPTEINPCWK